MNPKRKLLIVTQAVDRDDPVLGFFCRWVEEFAKHAERVEVICLREGKHELPENVRVHSLGKEKAEVGRQKSVGRRFVYAWRFIRLAWKLRRDYDAVFVHMNQEYVLLAAWLWRVLKKRVYLWRNHYAGSWLTALAASWCGTVFYTSAHSYTARFKNASRMPVGVDTETFSPVGPRERVAHSILFLSRMAPSKRPGILLDALEILAKENVMFSVDFVGSPLPQDAAWYEALKRHGAGFGGRVRFFPAVPNAVTPDLYRAHQVFVNASPSGMFDKTLFEAAACGCHVLAMSDDFAVLAGEGTHFSSEAELARKLVTAFDEPARPVPAFVQENSLEALASRLAGIMSERYASHHGGL